MGRRAYSSPPHRAVALALAAVGVLPWLGGCSTYVTQSTRLRPLVEAQKYDEALADLASLQSGGSRLLYLYESGLVLLDQGRWAASDSAFAAAEDALDDLYTRSLSREAGALLVQDGILDYRGDSFETALLHYYRIVNFLERGDIEGAAVQARRLEHQLQLWRDAGHPFAAEGFFAYVVGLVYREARERVDADVAFRNALSAYQAHGRTAGLDCPAGLPCDLAENAAALGDAEAAAQHRAEGDCAPRDRDSGRVVLLLESGYVPRKDVAEAVLPIFTTDLEGEVAAATLAGVLVDRYGRPIGEAKVEYVLRVSLPRLAEAVPGPASARMVAVAATDSTPEPARPARWTPDTGEVSVAERGAVTSIVGLDLETLSQAAHSDHQPAVLLRATVRGVTKYLAKRKAEKQGGKLAGFAVNVLGAVTETADTRCWSLLPRTILLAQTDLEAGSYRLVVDTLDRAGSIQSTLRTPRLQVRAGRTTFVRYRLY